MYYCSQMHFSALMPWPQCCHSSRSTEVAKAEKQQQKSNFFAFKLFSPFALPCGLEYGLHLETFFLLGKGSRQFLLSFVGRFLLGSSDVQPSMKHMLSSRTARFISSNLKKTPKSFTIERIVQF